MTCNLMYHYGKVCRGGASEASGATFTDHFAGAQDVTRALVCILAERACAKPTIKS